MHPLCSIYMPGGLFPQSLSKFSLVYVLAWHAQLHTPYISSLNHCLLFAALAHTIATRFVVVPRLCHLILVSLNPLLGILSCSLMPHIHLTILISAGWNATSFAFLMGQVSLSCSILLCTQLLYNLPLAINDISLLVSSGTNCLNVFHPVWILVCTAASASPSPLKTYPLTADLHWHQYLHLCNLYQLLGLHNLYKKNVFTLYMLPFIPLHFSVYPLLTTSTLYWTITKASTTDTTWPSYSLLCNLLSIPTN